MKCWHVLAVKDEVGLPTWKQCSREAKWVVTIWAGDVSRQEALCSQHRTMCLKKVPGSSDEELSSEA